MNFKKLLMLLAIGLFPLLIALSPVNGSAAAPGPDTSAFRFRRTTRTPTPTRTPTRALTPTPTPTRTSTPLSPTATQTTAPAFTNTPTPTLVSTSTPTPVAENTPTVTLAASNTPTTTQQLASVTPTVTTGPPKSQLPTIPGSYQPNSVSGNWRLVFDDEFSGSSLNLGQWQPNWLAGDNTSITKPVNGYEENCYDPAQVGVGGDLLTFSAVQRDCLANNGTTYHYASGLINSYSHFQMTYGFIEARILLDNTEVGVANWPAFWTDGTGTWPTTGEIDIMEGLGGQLTWHYHYGQNSQNGGNYPVIGPVTGWHTYAAEWQPGIIKWYFDGTFIAQQLNGVVENPMFLIANYGLSSQISGPIKVPSVMQVDYIRAWQH